MSTGGRPATRRQIGFVFQQHNLSPALNIRQNIQMGMQHSGLHRRPDAADSIQQIAERVGLAEHLMKYPEQLSGGQKQRAGIARALVARPRLVLADEPTASLDKDTGAAVMQLFDELAAGGGAVVLVTHDKRILDRADRVLSLEDRKVVPTADVLIEDTGTALRKLMQTEPARVQRLLRFASALATVALADGDVSPQEKGTIRETLLAREAVSKAEVDLVLELALAEASGHRDCFSENERIELAAAVEAVAAADGVVTDSERQAMRELLGR